MGRTVWYPGHMAKGGRKLREVIADLDLFIEVRDARAPRLTASPMAEELARHKPVWVVLARRDLADETVTRAWMKHFREGGTKVWAFDLRKGNVGDLRKTLKKESPSHRELRLGVVGIPNVGKSLLLNDLVGRKAAQVGAIAGVTRGVSWFRGQGFMVVDSPGILDPRSGETVHRWIAWLGSSKAEVIGGTETLACGLMKTLRQRGDWSLIRNKWGVPDEGEPEADLLEKVGRRLGCLVQGGRVDLGMAGKRLLDAFATGKLGPYSLEKPGEIGEWELED
jgi:ribosome biogenesis GTPase A